MLAALEVLAAIVIVASGGVVWTHHCNRTNKSNTDWLLATPWQHWSDLNGRERLQVLLLVGAAVALLIVSHWTNH